MFWRDSRVRRFESINRICSRWTSESLLAPARCADPPGHFISIRLIVFAQWPARNRLYRSQMYAGSFVIRSRIYEPVLFVFLISLMNRNICAALTWTRLKAVAPISALEIARKLIDRTIRVVSVTDWLDGLFRTSFKCFSQSCIPEFKSDAIEHHCLRFIFIYRNKIISLTLYNAM